MNTIRVFNHHIHVKFLLLALIHLAVIVASVFAAFELRYITHETSVVTSPFQLFGRSLFFALLMIVGLAAMGLFRVRRTLSSASTIARVVAGQLFGLLLAIVVYYVIPQFFLGRGVVAIAWVLSVCCVAVIQAIFDRLVQQSDDGWRVMIYGAGNNASELLAYMRRRSDQTFFNLLGCVVLDDEPVAVEPGMQVRPDSPLCEYAQAQQVNEIVVAMDDRRQNFPADALVDCRLAGINVVDTVTFYERQTGRVKIELLQPSWLIFSEGFHRGAVDDSLKRAVDLLASAILLAVTWPIALIAAIAIKLEDGWRAPVLYGQMRVGYQGRHFRIVKFRSMRTDAEKVSGAQWASSDDPRITRVGHWLRKLRIDELPQLWNVFRGDMSLVGPRPERPEFVDQLNERVPYYRVRECVPPGVTGWAQLGYPYGASEDDARAKLQFDLYYVKNRSLFLDLLILCNTVEVVLFRKGSR